MEENNLINHAKKEFKILGYPPMEECDDDPNKWIQENVLELLEVFHKQGHSGTSAKFTIDYFKKLASFEPLSPLTFDDNEWNDVMDNVYQNNRLSSVFKAGKDGIPYYIYGIVFRDKSNDYTYTGRAINPDTGEYVSSSQNIDTNKKFAPKTFYIDVVEKVYGDGDYMEMVIADPSSIEEVYEYYLRPEIAPTDI